MRGLTEFEKIKNATTIYVGCGSDIYTRYSFECKVIEKELKVLDIIINKQVNLNAVVHFGRVDIYNLACVLGRELTEDEFDLIQEVLYEN